jgi:hypothetical protein
VCAGCAGCAGLLGGGSCRLLRCSRACQAPPQFSSPPLPRPAPPRPTPPPAPRRLEQVARREAAPAQADGAGPMLRMRDTIVWGYLMSSPREGSVEVPEWYVRGLDPPSRRRASSSSLLAGSEGSSPRGLGPWQVLEGPRQLLPRLPDTADFLDTLAGLAGEPEVLPDGRPNLPERKAAAGLFRCGAARRRGAGRMGVGVAVAPGVWDGRAAALLALALPAPG